MTSDGGAGKRKSPPARGDRGPEREGDRSLSAEMGALLRELGAALGKFVIYPGGHPTLAPAVSRLSEQLGDALASRDELRLLVRRDRVEVGGGSTDPGNPLLSGLADRLHRHQLREIVFRPGISERELTRFLDHLSREPERDVPPLGSRDEIDDWENLELRTRRYDPLRMESGVSEEPAAPSPPGAEPPPAGSRLAGEDLLESAPSEVASAVRERLEEEDLDRIVAMQLYRLSQRLGEATGDEAEEIRERLSRVVLSLPSDVLGMLLELVRDGGEDDALLLAAARSMEMEATLRLVQAAAAQRDDVAEWLLSLILKLSSYDQGDRSRTPSREETVDELVDRILEAWDLEDPRPAGYQGTLRRMSRNPPGDAGVPETRARAIFVSPERVLKMGLELDEEVGYVQEAADQMIDSGRFGGLAELLEGAPGDNDLAENLWSRLAVPEIVERLLAADPPGFPLVDRLVAVAGVEVAPPLLDALSSQRSESRLYWRKVFNLLVRIGTPVQSLIPARMDDDRWYVRRNMLSLARELPGLPRGLDVLAYLEDEDPRVRSEALALALEDPESRQPALLAALEDPDTRMIGHALSAAEADCPAAAVDRVATIATSSRFASSHRVRAIRILADLEVPRALEALLELVWTRRWIFWRRIGPPEAATLEALAALARGWSDAPRAREALAAARSSDVPEIRDAAGGEEGR